MKISVVIPVFREEGINRLLDDLERREDRGDLEILVVDGDPDHGTLATISSPQVRLLSSAPGRGIQQNLGARTASGDVLLFLHADTQLPSHAFSLIRLTLSDPALAGGAFSLSYSPPHPALTLLVMAANLRSRVTGVPYGDQAIFLRRDIFQSMGGFLPVPLMEDLELMTRLRRAGLRIRILPVPIRTSSRRHLREGVVLCTLRNLLIRLLYHAGTSPETLSRLYRRHGS
jgi:rSAM/selenodomain-associated transferase 2